MMLLVFWLLGLLTGFFAGFAIVSAYADRYDRKSMFFGRNHPQAKEEYLKWD